MQLDIEDDFCYPESFSKESSCPVFWQRASRRTKNVRRELQVARNAMLSVWMDIYYSGFTRDTLAHLLGSTGIVVTTDYSGMGGAEMAVAFVNSFCSQKGIKHAGIEVYRAADLAPTCQQVLAGFVREGCCSPHVFGDIMDRLDDESRTKLVKLREHFLQRFEAERARLTQGPQWTLNEALAEERQKLSDEFLKAAGSILSRVPFSRDSRSRCVRCGQDVPTHPPKDGRLHGNIAGTTCVTWSSMNKEHLGWLHESSLPALVWIYENRAIAPDFHHPRVRPLIRHSDPERSAGAFLDSSKCQVLSQPLRSAGVEVEGVYVGLSFGESGGQALRMG